MKPVLTTIILLAATQTLWAHALWLETKPAGQKNQPHAVNVYFAEPADAYELTDSKAWNNVKNFDLYLITPKNEKIKLHVVKQKDRYTAAFTPGQDGRYFVVLENRKIGVIAHNPDKPYALFFYAASVVDVGHTSTPVLCNHLHNTAPMRIIPTHNHKDSASLWVQNLQDHKSNLTIFGPSGKIAEFKDISSGELSFKTAGAGQYKIEAITIDKTPGTLQGKAYKNTYHISTTMMEIPAEQKR